MIKLRTEELEALKTYNIEHMGVIKKLEDDIMIYTYLSDNLREMLKKPKQENTFEDGKTYVINHDDYKIGILFTSLIDEKGIIDLYIALLSAYRSKGYGSELLIQMTQFLIGEVKGIEDVRLNINKINKKANEIAVNNGFIKTDENEKNYVYKYFN